MNKTLGRSQITRYYDRNGKRVKVGDKIEFLFWVGGADGMQHEKYYVGRIVKRCGKLCFRYKPDPEKQPKYLSTRRLDNLNFDSAADWEILHD